MPVFDRHISCRLSLLLALLLPAPLLQAVDDGTPPPKTHAISFDAKLILGSRHDLTSFNVRAGAEGMEGVAYTDYGNPCIYCHLPPEKTQGDGEVVGGIIGWNRIRPVANQYDLFGSATLRNKPNRPSDISMLCLSCHDGTMAVDRVVFKPMGWSSDKQATLHMRLGASSDINSCGKCHSGGVAHDISVKALGTDLRDDHPISIRYAGFDVDAPGFKNVDGPWGFDNGVTLYDGMVECATCHDVHKPEAPMLLRIEPVKLCNTCHTR